MEHTFESTGRTVGRLVKALAIGKGNADAAAAFASSQNWFEENSIRSALLTQQKAAIGAITYSALPAGPVRDDFLAALRPRSILSRLSAATLVPLRVRVISFGAGSAGFEVGEGQPVPTISTQALAGVVIAPRRFAAISVVSDELLTFSGPGGETAITADLAAAVGMVEDRAFITPGLAGSILAGVTAIASAGTLLANVDTDLQAAIAALPVGADFTKLVWLMSPNAATKLASLRGSGGAAACPGIGPSGGTLLGITVLTSESAAGFLALLDQSGILLGGPVDVDVAASQETALQMLDNPIDSSVTPTATTLVPMFQTHSTAVRAAIYRGWFCRAGAAVYVTGGIH